MTSEDKTCVIAIDAGTTGVRSRAVFVGDDVTDEDGFRAVNGLGGITIRVGGSQGSEAEYSLPDVAAVHRWLESIEQRIHQ